MYKKLILTLSILLLSITSTYADTSVHNYSNGNNTPQYIKDDLTNFLGFSGNNGAKIYDKNGTVLYSNAVSGNYYGDNLYTIELLNGDTIFFVGLTNSADSISYIHSAQYVYYYNSINNTIYKSILATEGQTGYYCRNSNKVGFINNKLIISLKKESASNGNCTSGPTTALYEVDVTNHITSDNFLSLYNGILGNSDFKKFGNTGVIEGKIYQSGTNQIHYLNNSGYLEYSYCDGTNACASYSDSSGLTINDYRLFTNGTDKSVISYEYDNGTLESILYDNSNLTTYTDTFYTYYDISNDNYKKISASNSIANTYMSSMVYLEDNNGTVDYYYISGTQQYTSVTSEPYVDNTGVNTSTTNLLGDLEFSNSNIGFSFSGIYLEESGYFNFLYRDVTNSGSFININLLNPYHNNAILGSYSNKSYTFEHDSYFVSNNDYEVKIIFTYNNSVNLPIESEIYSFTTDDFINNGGNFSQTNAGFIVENINLSKDGKIKFKIENLDTGVIKYTNNSYIYANADASFEYNGNPYFQPGTNYKVNAIVSSNAGDSITSNDYTFTTNTTLYVDTDANGECPIGTTLVQLNIETLPVCAVNSYNENENYSFSGSDIQEKIDDKFNDISNYLGGTFSDIENKIKLNGFTGATNGGIITGDINDRLIQNINGVCDMFNSDGSFKVYGDRDYSISINILQNNSLDKGLIYIQYFVNFFTNPINNLIAFVSIFENFDDNQEICFLGQVTKIEYQSIFKKVNEGTSIIGVDNFITIGELTIFDYVALIIFGFIMSFGFVILFSKI